MWITQRPARRTTRITVSGKKASVKKVSTGTKMSKQKNPLYGGFFC